METSYTHSFITPLFLNGKRIGDISVVAQIHFDYDLVYSSHEIRQISLESGLNLMAFADWNYESDISLEEYLSPIIEKMIPEAKGVLERQKAFEDKDYKALQKTYRSLENQFICG